MALMKAIKNNMIGNSPFVEKKKQYKASTFILTNQIALNKGNWTLAEINKRQKKNGRISS